MSDDAITRDQRRPERGGGVMEQGAVRQSLCVEPMRGVLASGVVYERVVYGGNGDFARGRRRQRR
jgi:hypothetical protein